MTSSDKYFHIFCILKSIFRDEALYKSFKNFVELRTDTISKIKNHSDFDLLPKKNIQDLKFESALISKNILHL